MNLSDIFQFIAIPLVGWMLVRTNSHGERLVRIETKLDLLLPRSKNTNQE